MQTSDILSRLRIDALTPMQEAAAHAWQTGQDFVLLSPTGTGKTLAFLLPLALSIAPDAAGVQAIVLAPARELAQQTAEVFRQMGAPGGVACLHGGRPAADEQRALREAAPAFLVATPGRLADHLRRGNVDTRTVRTLVIDEFDKCLELGFQDEMEDIVHRLANVRRRVFLSATDAEEIPRFASMGREGILPLRLDYRQPSDAAPRLCLHTVASPTRDKLETLFQLLCTLGNAPALVFANHRESVDRIARFLADRRFPCSSFHGGMEQDDRERALYKLRNGTLTALVCTDLAARGLDIEGIQNIVHYHLPPQPDAFIHRNGRTARWEATGTAYLILGPDEPLPAYVPAGATPFAPTLPTPPAPRPAWATIYIGKGKRDRLSRADIVGFLCKKGGLAGKDLGRVDVLPRFSLAAVHRDCLRQLLRLVQGEKIKGLRTRIEEAK